MKVTTFDPYILVKDAEPVVRLFQDLGFEKRHMQEGISEENLTGIVMRDTNGFRVNIVQSDTLPRESLTGIRVNVDNFDEAYELLTAHGFTEAPGCEIVDTGSARALLMISPSRYLIELIQHIKNDRKK
jgi:hypothetical protein